jgi:hypothetical protein
MKHGRKKRGKAASCYFLTAGQALCMKKEKFNVAYKK